jgi:hypothetical protein
VHDIAHQWAPRSATELAARESDREVLERITRVQASLIALNSGPF